jgi:hypothetical protein
MDIRMGNPAFVLPFPGFGRIPVLIAVYATLEISGYPAKGFRYHITKFINFASQNSKD